MLGDGGSDDDDGSPIPSNFDSDDEISPPPPAGAAATSRATSTLRTPPATPAAALAAADPSPSPSSYLRESKGRRSSSPGKRKGAQWKKECAKLFHDRCAEHAVAMGRREAEHREELKRREAAWRKTEADFNEAERGYIRVIQLNEEEHVKALGRLREQSYKQQAARRSFYNAITASSSISGAGAYNRGSA